MTSRCKSSPGLNRSATPWGPLRPPMHSMRPLPTSPRDSRSLCFWCTPFANCRVWIKTFRGIGNGGRVVARPQAQLRKKLPGRFHPLETAVCEVLSETPRASSIVENLNSHLWNYFFLRRHIGNDYLHLLRFFLNHRRFRRSDRPERIGKSPAELLNALRHPHWLELRPCRGGAAWLPTLSTKLIPSSFVTRIIPGDQQQHFLCLHCYPKSAIFEPSPKRQESSILEVRGFLRRAK